MGIAVMLSPAWPGSFGRTVRDAGGKVLKRLVFEKSKPQVLDENEFAAVMPDIGKALVYPALDEAGNPTSKAARKETEDIEEKQPKRKKK
jgi:hypothetical protein